MLTGDGLSTGTKCPRRFHEHLPTAPRPPVYPAFVTVTPSGGPTYATFPSSPAHETHFYSEKTANANGKAGAPAPYHTDQKLGAILRLALARTGDKSDSSPARVVVKLKRNKKCHFTNSNAL